MSEEKYLYIKTKWCKRCNICVEFCPKKVFTIGKEGFPEPVNLVNCSECRLCITLCPDFAIFSDPENKKEFEER